jgi:hypothetical protein
LKPANSKGFSVVQQQNEIYIKVYYSHIIDTKVPHIKQFQIDSFMWLATLVIAKKQARLKKLTKISFLSLTMNKEENLIAKT